MTTTFDIDRAHSETVGLTADPLELARVGSRHRRFVWLDGDDANGRTGRSYLTWNPHRVLRAWGDRVLEERWVDGRYVRQRYTESPWSLLDRLLPTPAPPISSRPTTTQPGPRSMDWTQPTPQWFGGAIVALGFELYESIERLPALPPRPSGDPHAETPDLYVAFYDSALAVDSRGGAIELVSRVTGERPPSGPLSTWKADRLTVATQAATRDDSARSTGPASPLAPGALDGDWAPSVDFSTYARALARIRQALEAGDVYQVNYSHPLRVDWTYGALELFHRHRTAGRVPYGALIDMGDRAVCSFSPERFLSRKGDALVTEPIKGTRPRGATEEIDAAECRALRSSAKDHAEHIMIVDLERNDLGRVAIPGSIHVDPLCALESYPAVHHLVSRVNGRARPGLTSGALLRAMFPSGSVTGAPKVRAVELIRELEREPRHFYTGALGFWDGGGDCTLNVAIRTALLADGELEYRVGGGIVIDSDPAAEYAETHDKARALLRATRVDPA